jgi:predicted O-methyltransferase YrrM
MFVFHQIKPEILTRMKWLEQEDARDRTDGTQRMQRLRQIPPKTGRFLAILVANAPEGDIIEIGTSAGYSTLWLLLACAESNRPVTTFEVLDDKVELARETFRLAGVTDRVSLVHGDAKALLKESDSIAFCFLDAEKEEYQEFYDIVVPRLTPGGLLVADNVISHAEHLQSVVDAAHADERVDSVVVPIGKGELVCRKIP